MVIRINPEIYYDITVCRAAHPSVIVRQSIIPGYDYYVSIQLDSYDTTAMDTARATALQAIREHRADHTTYCYAL